ncbi:MAG: methionine adenosyltransferase [Kiritimatiellae bacterium]|nr:methionine adenosyltransferase [Kiritimatiellia bacterium]
MNTREKKHRHVFTSESVSEGHPDKVADQISDAILDACLKRDRNAHVACETAVGPDVVVNVGEISCRGFEKIDVEGVARDVVARIGYTVPDEHFAAGTFAYHNFLHGQSPDIARGVTRAKKERQGAGDQGMMFGYATNETESLMPAAIVYAHGLLRMFAELRRKDKAYAWLRPDAKSQLSVVYEDARPAWLDAVVVSHQTTPAGATRAHYAEIRRLAADYLSRTGLLAPKTKFYVNPTGKFVVGGPCGDSGLTGRKIIVDTYGGMAAHGGGAFSGKDPSKVDRSAAYYARYAAKNIVAANLADRCQIQVAYAIGVDRPVSFCVKTFGTAHGVTDAQIEKMLASGDVFDFRPYALTKDLGLLSPKGWSYEETAAYGHFGRSHFPWEKTNRTAALKSYFKLGS